MERNNTISNRVLLASFDKNWIRRRVANGHVVYISTKDNATVTVVVSGTKDQKLTFKKGLRIFVVGGTFHFPPHLRVFL